MLRTIYRCLTLAFALVVPPLVLELFQLTALLQIENGKVDFVSAVPH